MKEAFIPKIITFWFEEITPKEWFKKDDSFDESLRDRFGKLVHDALGARLDSWAQDRDGTMAIILLLDQMTRNIHRNTPLAFAGDDMALAHCLNAIEKGFLEEDKSARNLFMLMPMMHSEDIDIHKRALPIFEKYAPDAGVTSLLNHTKIIERFGHYPHRNDIIGRPSTNDEIAFLKEPGSSF